MSEWSWRLVLSVVWACLVAACLIAADLSTGMPVWWTFDLIYPVVVVLLWWAVSWSWRRIMRRRRLSDR